MNCSRETEKRKRLVCSTKFYLSGHAYSVNIAEQFLINFPSPKGFPFSAIDSHNLNLGLVTSSESFFKLAKHLAVF